MNLAVFYFLIALAILMSMGALLSRVIEVLREGNDSHLLRLTIVDRSGRTIGTRNVSSQEAERILHAQVPPNS
jgi:hypothetical protein